MGGAEAMEGSVGGAGLLNFAPDPWGPHFWAQKSQLWRRRSSGGGCFSRCVETGGADIDFGILIVSDWLVTPMLVARWCDKRFLQRSERAAYDTTIAKSVANFRKKFGKSLEAIGVLCQQALEAYFLEVGICGERGRQTPLPHQDETDGVTEGVTSAQASLKQDQRLSG
jgi:hypothetical protein